MKKILGPLEKLVEVIRSEAGQCPYKSTQQAYTD